MRSPTADLAKELGCSKLDALTEKRRAAEALAPYLHPKLSSLAIYPPGDPRSGVSTTLAIDTQDFEDITAAAIGENAADDTSVDTADLPPRSTLSLAEQEPAAADTAAGQNGLAQTGDAPTISEATVAKALDTLLTLARDPEIRRRMREMLE